MAERKWTAAQSAAIAYEGGDLLVSAAAGSGKTATLTEKVLQKILGDPTADLTRLLIVTFTRAAASELRERIAQGLTAAMQADPEKRRLVGCLTDLERAPICTIHSFCLTVLRPRAVSLGLPPDFAVAEETVALLMRREAMTAAVNDAFAESFPGDEETASFIELAEALGSSRDQGRIDRILLDLAERMYAYGCDSRTLVHYADRAMAAADGRDDAFLDELFLGVRRRVEGFAAHYAALFERLAKEMEENEPLRKHYLPEAVALADYGKRLERLCRDFDREAVADAIKGFSANRLGSVKEEFQTEASAYFKSERTAFQRELGDLLKKYFSGTTEELLSELRRTARLARMLARVTEKFDEIYRGEKKRRNLMDFSDLETETHRLLVAPDGTPTSVAEEAAEGYDAVFIDEYQDTNRLQDEIFRAVAMKCPRFMVGDVKQSIYAFRGAKPEVFSSYRDRFAVLDPLSEDLSGDGGVGRSLFLRENFRCDLPVIETTNLLSEFLFPEGHISYRAEEDNLVFSKPAPHPETWRPTEVAILSSAEAEEGEEDREAAYVAERIASMIGREKKNDGSTVKASDVAILLRSPTSGGQKFADALKKRGIASEMSRGEEFFERPEILLALAMLYTVDNPSRDVYLAAYMKSPLCGFTLDEMIAIRRNCREGALWDAVRQYRKTGSDSLLREKCDVFSDKLLSYRKMARGARADKLIRYLYGDSGILHRTAGSGRDGGERRNLLALYDLARRYEADTFGGLYGFLRYVKDLTEKEGSSGVAIASEGGAECVKILSIHQSKGLEYPVVFLCDTARRFNQRDAGEELLFTSEGFLALRLPDPGGFVRCDNRIRQAVAASLRERTLDEEMRVLYVAVTRARERLIITSLVKDPQATLRRARTAASYHSGYAVRRGSSYLDWILGAYFLRENVPSVRLLLPDAPTEDAALQKELSSQELTGVSGDGGNNLEALLAERFSFRYPYEHLSHLPAKLIVSKLHPGVIDPAEEEGEASSLDDHRAFTPLSEKMPLPVFMSGMPAHTAAETGIATHAFFEFCSFEKLSEPGGIDSEMKRLVQEGFITEEMSRLVRREDIEKFLRSELFRRMSRARDVKKEFRFYAAVPACELTLREDFKAELAASGADVLVQGVVDCFFEDENGRTVLVDYKTDRLSAAELADVALAAEKLVPRHRDQLLYYRRACEKMLGRPMDEVYIYSLPLGEWIPVE